MMPQSAVTSVPASEVLLFLRNLHVSLLPWNSHHPLRPIFFCWAYEYVYHQHGGDEVDSIRRNARRFHRHRISTIKDREPLGTKPTGSRQSSWGRSFAVSFSSSRPMIIMMLLAVKPERKRKSEVAFPGSAGTRAGTQKFRTSNKSPFLLSRSRVRYVGHHDGTALGRCCSVVRYHWRPTRVL